MTILASTSGSLKLSLAKGETLVIRNYSGTETVTGSTVAREDATATLGAGAYIYGPQTAAASVTVSTTGTLDYQAVMGDPTPSSGASGFTKNPTTGMAETDVGGETFVALPRGSNGEARGVYVGRTGTLASLIGQTESANENEIAVATDQPALVRYGSNESANYLFTPELTIDVGNITYGGVADGIGWFLSEGFPNFRLPAGVRRILLISTRVDKGLHPDLRSDGASSGAINFQVPLAEYQRYPRYEIIIAAKLDVGGGALLGFSNDGGDGVGVDRTNVSSTNYWPPVIECVAGPNLSSNNGNGALILRPTSVSAVTVGQAHIFVAA